MGEYAYCGHTKLVQLTLQVTHRLLRFVDISKYKVSGPGIRFEKIFLVGGTLLANSKAVVSKNYTGIIGRVEFP